MRRHLLLQSLLLLCIHCFPSAAIIIINQSSVVSQPVSPSALVRDACQLASNVMCLCSHAGKTQGQRLWFADTAPLGHPCMQSLLIILGVAYLREIRHLLVWGGDSSHHHVT